MKRITKHIGVKRQYFTPKVRLIELDKELLLVESPTGGDDGMKGGDGNPPTEPDPDDPYDPFV